MPTPTTRSVQNVAPNVATAAFCRFLPLFAVLCHFLPLLPKKVTFCRLN
jgi:hypothetical protein